MFISVSSVAELQRAEIATTGSDAPQSAQRRKTRTCSPSFAPSDSEYAPYQRHNRAFDKAQNDDREDL